MSDPKVGAFVMHRYGELRQIASRKDSDDGWWLIGNDGSGLADRVLQDGDWFVLDMDRLRGSVLSGQQGVLVPRDVLAALASVPVSPQDYDAASAARMEARALLSGPVAEEADRG